VGKRCLESGEFTAYDTGLRVKVPNVYEGVILYLTEALQCFRAGTYLGSAVMLGVASETVLLALRAAVENAFTSQQDRKRFAAKTVGKTAKTISDEIYKRLDPNMEQITAALGREDITAELSGIFQLIRKTRNEAGHPTGRKIEREEAFALIQLFPSYCGIAYEVISCLKPNSI
jgi:hypothetical protein